MQKDIKPILEKVESGTYNGEEERIAKLWLFQLRSKDLDQISEAELEDTSEQIWNRLQPDAASPVRRFKGLHFEKATHRMTHFFIGKN